MHLEFDRAHETIFFKGPIEEARWLLQQDIPNFQDWKTKLRQRLDREDPQYDLTHLNNVVDNTSAVIETSTVPVEKLRKGVRNHSSACQVELTVLNDVHIRTSSLQVV